MSIWNSLHVEREVEAATIYRLRGTLTDDRAGYRFLDGFRRSADANASVVVLNLEEIVHVTSGGVGLIAACYTAISNARGRLYLVGMTSRVRAIIGAVGLTSVIECVEVEADVVTADAA